MDPINRTQPPVGIDLGTTYSVVAYVDAAGRPNTLPNSAGEHLTPTAVLFDADEVIVGREAVRGSITETDAYAECFKRDMGGDAYRRPIRQQTVPPEILSALVLERLKQDATEKLGPIKDVVITVPAFFDEVRRKATQDAGKLAGLNVLDIINEPTAAAVAYAYQQDRSSGLVLTSKLRERVLVCDLGGGTFDVTVLEVDGHRFRTIATDGDVQLGGRDFDERVVNLVAERFVDQHGVDPRSDAEDAAQLWLDASDAKHALTERSKTTIVCYHLGLRLRVEITRTEFEEATIDLLERAEAITSQITAHARLDWSKIDRVLAVGGASRMPMFTQMLATVTGKKPHRSLSADEAVAQGAAIYCGMLIEDGSDRGSRHNLVNVNSHSPGAVGLDLTTGQARHCILIPRNTALPCCVTRVFRTARHNQRSVALNIRQQLDSQYMQIARTVVAARSGLPPELDRKGKQLVDVANDAATAQHQLNKLAFGARPAQAAVERIQRGTQIARLKQKLNECCQQERLLQVALGRLAIEARIALPNNSRELVAIRQLQSMRHAKC